MNTVTLTVTIETDGDPEEMALLTSQYLTLPGHPFLVDYGPDADGGYEGPFVRNITVKRQS